MTLKLPQPTPQYDLSIAQRAKQALEAEDVRNRKMGADLALTSERLTLLSPNGTRYQVVVSDTGVISVAPALVSGNAIPDIAAACGVFTLTGEAIKNGILLPASDSAAKAWVSFTGVVTPVIKTGYNAASVTRSALGTYVFTFTTPFATADYECNVTPEASGTFGWGQVLSKTASAVTVAFIIPAGPAGFDPTIGHVVCFGRQ